MSTSQKKALFLGGGPWQVPFIQYLKNQNIEVTVVDPSAAPAGAQTAAHHMRLDARDADAIAHACVPGEFDYVTSDQSDAVIESVARVARSLRTQGNDPAAVRLFSDKTQCRELAARIGVPQPQFKSCTGEIQVREFAASRPGPCILKPADSQSSRGVVRLESAADPHLAKAVSDALEFSFSKKVIVEDFVSGREVTVEGICSGSKHRGLAISIKDHFRTALASKLLYPAGLPVELEEEIFTAMDKFVESSGLRFGITHAEFIVDVARGKFWLVEIACRGGGTLISSDIAPWVSGVNFYDILFGDLQGRSTDLSKLRRQTNGAMLGFFEFQEGKVHAIHGVAEARAMPGVHRLQLEFKIGDVLHNAADDRGRQGFAILFGKSAADVEAQWEKVRHAVRVETR